MTRYILPSLLAVGLGAAGFAALSLDPAPAEAQSVGECPQTLPGEASEMTCSCSASDGSSTVWGTDFYTDDSNLCNAAVHAGAIPASGGTIRVHALPGRDDYSGSQRNGISTRDYGSWRRTIAFDAAGPFTSYAACPGTYNANGTSWSGTCSCTAATSGSVWGSGPYTTDSDLCRAARHAGAIGASGGVVRVAPAAGRSSYAGSTRNGVTTNSWGSYGSSFTVSK